MEIPILDNSLYLGQAMQLVFLHERIRMIIEIDNQIKNRRI
jgi:hypothetical protein